MWQSHVKWCSHDKVHPILPEDRQESFYRSIEKCKSSIATIREAYDQCFTIHIHPRINSQSEIVWWLLPTAIHILMTNMQGSFATRWTAQCCFHSIHTQKVSLYRITILVLTINMSWMTVAEELSSKVRREQTRTWKPQLHNRERVSIVGTKEGQGGTAETRWVVLM